MEHEQNNRNEIKLTDNPLENIKMMAPYLSEKQQYILLGMIMQMATEGDTNIKISA